MESKVNKPTGAKTVDMEAVRRSCALLLGPVAELRIPKCPGRRTVSGYFDDADKLAKDAAEMSGKAAGVYLTLNPVVPDLLARAKNRLISFAETTTRDNEILARRWFFIDFDARRPAGISATDDEHHAAMERARLCREWLRTQGWPAPILADSGNGAHLLYRVELENSKENAEMLKSCLLVLGLQFSDDDVEVDPTAYNAARVVKIWGTLAAKGDNIPERPHRLSGLVEVPSEHELVPVELLRALEARLPPSEPQDQAGTARSQANNSFDVVRWIAEHNLEAKGPTDWNGGRKWMFDVCPFNGDHRNRSAFIVQLPNGAVAARCHHKSCDFKNWHALRDLIEPGWRDHSAQCTTKGAPAEEGDTEEEGGPAKESASSAGAPRGSKATRLIKLAESAGSEFFHTPDQRAYVRLRHDGHREVWPVASSGFRHYLVKLFFDNDRTALSSESLRQALNVLQGTALYAGKEHPVCTRAAYLKPDIYLDLGDPAWRSVRIHPGGWEVTPHPDPVRFRRAPSMLPLADPQRGPKVQELWKFSNLIGRERLLFGGWLLYALRACGPYPILILNGEEGSAKTTAAWVVKALIDPSKAPTRGAPKTEDDLMIAAQNSHVVAFDNISYLSPELADAICRLATGGGLSKRQLYTDDEEHVLESTRPVLITGIEPLALRGDFADRAVVLTLPQLTEKMSEKKFKEKFQDARPCLLGALLDCLSEALRKVDAVELEQTPRMVDFTCLGVAAEKALGFKSGDFLSAYLENRREARETLLEASSLAIRLRQFMEPRSEWRGAASELLDELNTIASDQERRRRSWPKTPQALSGTLMRLAPSLRQVGIEVERDREGHSSRRFIEIHKVGKSSSAASASSASSPPSSPSGDADIADSVGVGSSADDADDADDEKPTLETPATGNSKLPGGLFDNDDAVADDNEVEL
jgi:hypothetical protein